MGGVKGATLVVVDGACYSGRCKGCDICANADGQFKSGIHCRIDSECESHYCIGSSTMTGSCTSGTCR